MIGIYIIRNKINGKVYVGQSWDIKNRWKAHIKTGKNKHLHSSFEKYGLENFAFEVLKELNETATQLILDNYEEHFIEKYNSMNPDFGYNKESGGSNGKPSEETKLKMSNSHKNPTDEIRKKMSKNNKGKIISNETRRRISESSRGRVVSDATRKKISESQRGKIASIKARRKMSESAKGKIISDETRKKLSEIGKKKIICLTTGEVFNSQTEAANSLKLYSNSISNVCNGKQKTTGGYRFRFYVDIDIPA